jgi:hypothetical protein
MRLARWRASLQHGRRDAPGRSWQYRGRTPDVQDDDEFILLRVPEFLRVR